MGRTLACTHYKSSPEPAKFVGLLGFAAVPASTEGFDAAVAVVAEPDVPVVVQAVV